MARLKSAIQTFMGTPCICGHKRRNHVHTAPLAPQHYVLAICLFNNCNCEYFEREESN